MPHPDRRYFPLRRKIAIIVREIFIPSLDDNLTVGERWERRVEGPMFIASLLFLALYVLSACVNPGSTESIVAETGMWILWATFLADYLARLALAENRWKWIAKHWWELVLIVLPMFRPLRILRILPTLVLLQRFSSGSSRVTVSMYTSVASTLIVLVSSVTFYEYEAPHPGSPIQNFGDSIYWAMTTMTTVGYGDIVPMTIPGKIIAVTLMATGIAVFGIATAMVSSWLVQQVQDDAAEAETVLDDDRHTEVMAMLADMRHELTHMRKEINDLHERVRNIEREK